MSHVNEISLQTIISTEKATAPTCLLSALLTASLGKDGEGLRQKYSEYQDESHSSIWCVNELREGEDLYLPNV